MLLLGDLLQLPPVFEGPVYTPLTAELTQKYTGCLGTVNLWRKLFSYNELAINMQQKDDKTLLNYFLAFGWVISIIKILNCCESAR